MKPINIAKVLLCSALISLCCALKMTTTETPFIQVQSPDFTARIEALFSDPKRQNNPCDCDKPEDYVAMDSLIDNDPEKEQDANNNSMWSLPKKKKNKYEMKNIGWDASAYFFDFLDPVLQKPIADEFQRIYTEALKIPDEPGYLDPYTLEKMANPSGSTLGGVLTQAESVKKITSLMPSFNFDQWQKYISAAKLTAIVKAWAWDFNVMKQDFAKEMVDKFDFDGDGRLSPSEFTILMIINNKKSRNALKSCTNCMEDIIRKMIDPMYLYIDCDGDNVISSENIWNSLKGLNRKEAANTYNIYNCVIDGSQVRTVSINDFVLKSQKFMPGKLTKEEFRYGVLLGYWNRQIDPSGFLTNPTGEALTITSKINGKNMKSLRWGDNGSLDRSCENLKKFKSSL